MNDEDVKRAWADMIVASEENPYRMGHYKLEGREVVPVKDADFLEWSRWFERTDRQVALDRSGQFSLSTIFLGMDHRVSRVGPPLLFEAMLFGRVRDLWFPGPFPLLLREVPETLGMWRYSTLAEAEAGHARIAAVVKRVGKGPYQTRRLQRALARMREDEMPGSYPFCSHGRSIRGTIIAKACRLKWRRKTPGSG